MSTAMTYADVAAANKCPDCWHSLADHTEGGMCGGDGTVCHCIRMASSIRDELAPGRLAIALTAWLDSTPGSGDDTTDALIRAASDWLGRP